MWQFPSLTSHSQTSHDALLYINALQRPQRPCEFTVALISDATNLGGSYNTAGHKKQLFFYKN